MNLRPYWQFYKSIFPFAIGLGFIMLAFLGALWGFLLFILLGVPVGFLGFKAFRNDEFYFYYNLGITKFQLAKVAFIFNLIIGLPIFGAALLLFLLIFGQPSII